MAEYEYSFGCLQWQGETYRKDVIILPDRVLSPWQRAHGHRLKFKDLSEALADGPSIIVIGTGKMGVMEVPDKVLNKLAEAGVDGRPMPTEQALKHFADLRAKGKRVVAALHLTC